MAVDDGSLKSLLQQRRLFLMPERRRTAVVVYVCVDDGFPGGFPVGRVIPSEAGTWSAYARVRPGHVFTDDRVSAGLPSLKEAVRAVVDHAHFGDVQATHR
ncbi:hypothetical protein [Streptomyces sp. F001]|uniref:hypothetical protein n=1 Tax=Streptomyces sp. F001 TaxID=1510026 RepID=UPI00101E7243|nr:hypothetical protein [Streptomyces sp. F001]RZB17500.1 hypothetical protein StrepF001_22770 [Streptomyces sp. F001]